MTPNQPKYIFLYSLIFSICLLTTVPGCDLLFPTIQPVNPDNPPKPVPADPYFIRKAAREAAAKMTHSDKLMVYGMLEAGEDYVVKHTDSDTITTHDLIDLMGRALDNTGYVKAKYPEWTAVVERAWKSYQIKLDNETLTLENAIPFKNCSQQLKDVLELLALGCSDTL